jgi:hypothetical protein
MKNQNLILAIVLSLAINLANGQATTAPGNNWLFGPEYLGWDNSSPTPLLIQHLTANQPIRFLNFDNNVGAGVVAPKMEITVGGAMIDDAGAALPNDGVRLWNPGYVGSFGFPSNRGALDIWTGNNNTTHIRFDGGGAIHTQNNRMEIIGKRNGLWLGAAPDFNFPLINARIFFNIGTVAGGGDEYGRFSNDGTGNNIGFLRIGVQPIPAAPIDADRRLEVFDAAAQPQFRITQAAGTNFADFQVTNLGDLSILPWAAGNNRRVGINTTTPQNTLDINANGNYVATAPNSGLRLRDMRSGSSAGPSNGKVLSVDVDGNVILVDDIGGGNISSSCGSLLSNYITKATGANTICQSSIWENNNADAFVGIGTNNPISKLHLYRAVTSTPTYNDGYWSELNGGSNCRGFVSLIQNTHTLASTNMCYRAFITAQGGSGITSANYGFNASIEINAAAGSSLNYGAHLAVGSTQVNAYKNFGVFTKSINANEVYGAYFSAIGGSILNYGVYAAGGQVCTTAVNPTNCSNAAGYFSGDVGVTNALYVASDAKLKDNIAPLTNANALLMQMVPVTYHLKDKIYPSMHLGSSNNFGLIADDLKMLLPELVRGFAEPEVTDSTGKIMDAQVDFQAINYTGLIPILIAGYQQQKKEIDSLKVIVANNNPLKSGNTNTMQVALSNQTKIILNQNDPNPFAENTTIKYFIPENVNAAQLLFYNNTGTIFKTIDIFEKGQGSILIYGSNLTSGIYTYTLLADGKVMETKRMVKIK